MGATCVDAGNNLKKLSLTQCVSIRGHSLAPLRDSFVLVEIDLSLADEYTSPIIDPAQMISDDAALPILESILNKIGNALKCLRLPKAWKKRKAKSLGLFLEAFDRVVNG